MAVLEVNNITKTFGDQRAVDDISFKIEEGVIFGLLGPNGAGKTTSIRMIMDIIIPDTGSISIMGDQDPRSANDVIGYLPEERGMYRKMKVGDLLFFLTKLKNMEKKTARKSIDEWLERLDIMDWKKKKIEELSKGMQQKIQFLGTILHQPKLLILDEPFGGLDPINQNLIKDILLELKSKGTTIIFSTHVMESAEKLCEEIFLINRGKQVLYDKLAAVKQSFGKQTIHLEFDGDKKFLETSKQIKKFSAYENSAEVQLKEDGDAQVLLMEAAKSATIRKFEMKEPSLHEIFIETVGSDIEEGGTE